MQVHRAGWMGTPNLRCANIFPLALTPAAYAQELAYFQSSLLFAAHAQVHRAFWRGTPYCGSYTDMRFAKVCPRV